MIDDDTYPFSLKSNWVPRSFSPSYFFGERSNRIQWIILNYFMVLFMSECKKYIQHWIRIWSPFFKLMLHRIMLPTPSQQHRQNQPSIQHSQYHQRCQDTDTNTEQTMIPRGGGNARSPQDCCRWWKFALSLKSNQVPRSISPDYYFGEKVACVE